MPPVHIYTQSPISPARARALDPEAEASAGNSAPVAPSLGTVGCTSSGTSSHPPVRPGAVPLPVTPVPTTPARNPPHAPRPATIPYPAQMRIPAPVGASSLQRGTAPVVVPAPSPFVAANSQQYGDDSLLHPPGYQQNAHATDFSSHQRAAHSTFACGDGRLGPGPSEDYREDGVWDAAVKLAQTAGEKLAAAETDIWKRIN